MIPLLSAGPLNYLFDNSIEKLINILVKLQTTYRLISWTSWSMFREPSEGSASEGGKREDYFMTTLKSNKQLGTSERAF